MIRFENVTYRYNENQPPALLNVSIEIDAGESVCVMGANGSGKSTFAKLIAGLVKNQQGRFRFDSHKNSIQPVGLLFQNPDNQIVAVTVEKEIAFGLENQGLSQPEMEQRIKNVLERLSISELRNRLTSELSVGEKQRVALASVLVCEPSVVVLDEPDSFLDKEGKRLFRELMRALREHNRELTIIEITQYPQIARTYERLIVFDNGRIVSDSPVSDEIQDFKLPELIEKKIAIPDEWKSNRESRKLAKIVFERVSYSYPGSDKDVLSHFTAELSSSEITFVVGPSGSGKSTLGMLVCGINQPDSGTIEHIDSGNSVFESQALRGLITAALQQPERQFFLNSCKEEIEFGAANFKRNLSSKTIRTFFEMVGLSFESFSVRDPFTLSLGEKRRLAFGSVLSISPDFIVFDEPTCALDQEGIARFVLLAKALKSHGLGVVIISHDDDIVKTLADKVIALDGKGNFWTLSKEKYLAGLSEQDIQVAK